MVEFHLARLQTVLFLTSLDATKKLNLAMAVRDASDGLLDADPLILPIPSDAPPEFPRLQLKSSDKRWMYQLAGNRLDFVFELPPDKLGNSEFVDIIQRQAHVASAVWDTIQAKHSASGNRIGVVSLFVSFPDDPIRVLQARFMQPSDAPVPHELQLHALHKMVLGQVSINRWTRCFAGELISGGNPRDSLRVEVDINTLSEQHFDLNSARILDFTNIVKDLVVDTMASLFEDAPSGGKVF